MSKTALIIQREYLSRVMKKSFLLTTILVPILIGAFYALMMYIGFSDTSNKQRIAVIDEAGIVTDSLMKSKKNIEFTMVKGQTEQSYLGKYKQDGYDAFLYVPKLDISNPSGFVLHSSSSASISTIDQTEDMLNKVVEQRRMIAQGIDPAEYNKISAKVNVRNVIETSEGAKTNVAELAYFVSMACGIMIYLMMIIYGSMVMRGVSEEKINRISEVVVSSAKPFELMMGKVIGIGFVGLTQFAIWMVLGLVVNAVVAMVMPHTPEVANAAAAMNEPGNKAMMNSLLEGVNSLPLAKIITCFAIYFLLGYLTYAALFAAVGSVVSDDQSEAQQLVFPIMMPIILGFVIMMKALSEPNSGLAVFGSLFPLTSPVVMMGRITFDIPFWQIALSIVFLILGFLALTWLAAKIYRTGILMYGKKPSWKEMMKWAFAKG